MPLDIQLVHPFDKAHEHHMWESLCESMFAAFKDLPGKALLLGNFNCGRQIDACLVTGRGLAVIELKNYSGQLHAPPNERWFAGTSPVHAGGALNPLEQMRGAKHAIVDRLRRPWSYKFPDMPPPNWKYSACRAVFNPGTEWVDLLDPGVHRWFKISTLDAIASELRSLSIDTFDLSAAQIDFVRKTILSIAPRRIVHKEQKEIMANGLQGITVGHLTLGSKVAVTHGTAASMDKQNKNPVPAVFHDYTVADEDGFVLHLKDMCLENGERHIFAGDNFSGEKKWDRLQEGMRLGVYPRDGGVLTRLALARPNEGKGKKSTRGRSATREQLDEAAGLDVFQTLLDLGALKVGTRAEVYGETNRERNTLCVLYPTDKPEIGLVAYILTTIFPLMQDEEEESGVQTAAA